jgi:DNA-binding MarR family transcriptional regulator
MPGQTDSADASSRRAELLQRLQIAGREQSAATVMFHTALAAKQDLSATEEKALDLLDRFGPLTAGQLAQRSGLAPASVTGLVDRLERKGFARRVPHPVDKRSVLIEVRPDRLAMLGPLFDDWWRSLTELFSSYSDEQLETILHFLNEATRRQHEATARLTT